MDFFLILVIAVLSWYVFSLNKEVSRLEKESLRESLTTTSLLRVLFTKKLVSREDILNAESKIRRDRSGNNQIVRYG